MLNIQYRNNCTVSLYRCLSWQNRSLWLFVQRLRSITDKTKIKTEGSTAKSKAMLVRIRRFSKNNASRHRYVLGTIMNNPKRSRCLLGKTSGNRLAMITRYPRPLNQKDQNILECRLYHGFLLSTTAESS